MNYTGLVTFDIETGPADDLQDHLIPFDSSEVKTGNIKDPAKIQEKINEAQRDHFSKQIEKAALSPITGKILAIGIRYDSNTEHGREVENLNLLTSNKTEADLIEWFMHQVGQFQLEGYAFGGWNIHGFDMPFILKRAMKLNPEYLSYLGNIFWEGRYYRQEFYDGMLEWSRGQFGVPFTSLNTVSKYLGMGVKNGDGKDFASVLESDPEKARGYLSNDLEITHGTVNRILRFKGIQFGR